MKYNFEFKENDYKTPPVLYQKALKRFGIVKFNLDVCCADKNIPAICYFVNGEKDGLKEEWRGYCWCNPPFNECKKWVKKAFDEHKENRNKIAMLIPARTETAYWHEYILNNPNCKIYFLKKGYKFLNRDNQEMGIFKNALALVYFE